MSDLISRQAAIDTEGLDEQIKCEMCRNPMHTVRGCDGNCKYDERLYERIIQILDERIKPLPSAQPEPHEERTKTHACDLIDRQAAVDAIGKTSDELYENIKKGATFPQRQWFDGMAQAQSILENLPSAQPERMTNR